MRQAHAPNSVTFFYQIVPNPTIFLFQDQTASPSNSSVVNDPVAETGDGGTQNQALRKEIQTRLKEIFAWLQKDARDQIRDLDHFEEMLDQSAKSSLKTSRLHWSPSLVWIFIMWQ
jgi:hypothetical protein